MRNSVRTIAATLVLAALGMVSPSAQQREGIKVHGDWVIEVRNPDGTLVNRYEFKNALVGPGHVALSRVLTRNASIGHWEVTLGASDAPLEICRGISSRSRCISSEDPPIVQGEDGFIFETLQLSYPQTPTGPDESKVQLSGTVTASFDGNIQRVDTRFASCTAETAPSSCERGGQLPFTARVLAAPISVAAGQIVQFKVILSFS